MAKHKVPNYHSNRCERCGRFKAGHGGYLMAISLHSLYNREVCRSCCQFIMAERYYW